MSPLFEKVFKIAEYVIYGAQAWTALYGAYLILLLFQQIGSKRMSSKRTTEFFDKVRESYAANRPEEVQQLCDTPTYWSKLVPQLILVALQRSGAEIGRLRRVMIETYERDVVAELNYLIGWVNTIIKSAPMLGLLGTVQGMIGAFAKIATAEKGIDPKQLAGDISFALWTTAIGLLVAIPLTLCLSSVQVRMGKMQDEVQQGLNQYLEAYDAYRQRKAA